MELNEVSTERAVDMQAENFKVELSVGGEYAVEGTNFNFTIRSSATIKNFIPKIKFTGIPEDFNVIEVDVKNTTNEAVKMYLRINYADGTFEMKDAVLTENTFATLELLCRGKKNKRNKRRRSYANDA